VKLEIKDIDQCVKEMTITIPSEDAAKDYRTVLNKFKNYVVVPGFRKGKAPLAMVENVFAEQAREAYLKEKVYDYYETAIKENEIEPLHEGVPVSVDWEKGKELVMVFRYEVKPTVVIEKYTGMKVESKLVEFNENMVDETIENIREKMGKEETKERPARDKDIIVISMKLPEEESENGKENEQNPFEIALNDNDYGKEFNEALTGSQAGDELKTTANIAGKEGVPVIVNVREIKEKILPDVTEELAKESGFDSLEAMRKDIGENLRKRIEQENLQRKKTLLLTSLIKENPFDIPPSSVIYYSHKLAEPYARMLNKKPEELAEYYRETAFFEIKAYYITSYLVEKLNFEVSEEDKNLMINEMAEELELTPEEYREKNPDVTKQDDFVNRIKEKKLYDFLFENNEFVEPEERVEEEKSPEDDNSPDSSITEKEE